MPVSLHPAVATSAAVILVMSYLYGGYWISSLSDEGEFDVPTVLDSLLHIEASVGVRQGASVAVAFGACLDRLASSADVMQQLRASCRNSIGNVAELSDVSDLEKTFAYYFSNGASAGRAVKNASFYAEVEHAFTSLPSSRLSVGGNAPVMVQRFVTEGVQQVTLAANMSPQLRSQLHSSVRVIGDEVSKSAEDTHFILEYEANDVCGNWTAPRANRFIMYQAAGPAQFHMTSLVEQFTRELMRSPPDLLVIGGLRQLLGAETLTVGGAPSALTRLSQLLRAAQPSLRVHVELSTFSDQATLRRVIEHVMQYSDSLGLNEQELPAVRRLLANWHDHRGVANGGRSGHSSVDSGHGTADSGHCGRSTKEDSGHSVVDSDHTTVDSGHDEMDTGRHGAVGNGQDEEDVGHREMLVEDSFPSLSSVLDDARVTFQLLRHLTSHNQRPFSRLHMHTLAFQVMVTEADSRLWPNMAAAMAKASLTAYRHTCGSRTVDVSQAKLLLRDTSAITMDQLNTPASQHRLQFTGARPVVCWRETDAGVSIDICVAPVIVCRHVVQTVGGGDNISAAALALQI